MELRVIEENDKYVHLALIGRLDVAGVQAVELKFICQTSSTKKPSIVDLSETTYIASLGLRMLIENAKALKRAGARMVVLKPQPLVEDILRNAGLGDMLNIVHDEAEARALAGAT